jgi:hypothetical protein
MGKIMTKWSELGKKEDVVINFNAETETIRINLPSQSIGQSFGEPQLFKGARARLQGEGKHPIKMNNFTFTFTFTKIFRISFMYFFCYFKPLN